MQTKSENNCRHSHKRDLSFSKRGLLSLSIGHSLFHAGGGVEGGVKPSRVGQDGPTHPPLKQNGHHCDNYYDVRYLNNCFSKPVLK